MHPSMRGNQACLRAGLVAIVVASGAVAVAAPAAAAQARRPTVTRVTNTHFNTATGSTGGGPRITIRGSNFRHVKAVTFGGRRGRALHVSSPTMLQVTLPVHAAGRVDVRVRTSAGLSPVNRRDRFFYQIRRRVDGGSNFSCRVNTGLGTVSCWGSNTCGQLGNGATKSSQTPVPVKGLTRVVSIASGNLHSCALLAGGAVKCWGYNTDGQLGNGQRNNSRVPVTVVGLGKAIAITAGGYHTCAILTGNGVRCWGHNRYGELGTGNTGRALRPQPVRNLKNAVDVAAGQYFTCATRRSGAEACWGINQFGDLGNGGTKGRTTPVSVLGL